ENKPWLDAGLFASEVVLKVVSFVRGENGPGVVLTAEKDPVAVRRSRIPVNDSDGKIYGLAERLNPVSNLLPKRALSGEGATILESWAALMGKGVEQLEESLTAESLGEKAAECKNLTGLGGIVVGGTGVAALVWVNELLSAVPKEGLQSYVRSRAVLPSQMG